MNKAAVQRLENAIKDATTKKTSGGSAAASAKRRGRPARAPQPAVEKKFVEAPDGIATEIPSVVRDTITDAAMQPCNQAEDIDTTKPFICRIVFETARAANIKEMVDKFAQRFAGDPVRGTAGRSQRRVSSEILDDWKVLLGHVFGVKLLSTVEPPSENGTAVTAYAVAKECAVCSAENGFVATMRLGIKGTRSVICVKTRSFLEHMEKSSQLEAHKGSPQCSGKGGVAQAYNTFKSLSVDAAKGFLDSCNGNTLWHATVGPRDLLFMPAGYMFFEKIGAHDVLGIRQALVFPSDIAELSELRKALIAIGSPSENLQRIVDLSVNATLS